MEAAAAKSEPGAETPSAIQLSGPDTMALIQAGVDTEYLKLALHLKEVKLELKTRVIELMHLRIRPTSPSDQFDEVNALPEFRKLILMEEFKYCLPENIVVYLSEQKVDTLFKAAVLAYGFVLAHCVVFPSVCREHTPSVIPKAGPKNVQRVNTNSNTRECFYCHETRHLIADCPTKTVQRTKSQSQKAERCWFC